MMSAPVIAFALRRIATLSAKSLWPTTADVLSTWVSTRAWRVREIADTATRAATDVARRASSANGMAIRWWSRSRPCVMMPRSSEAHDVVGVGVANRSARRSEVADDWRDGGRFDDRVVLGQNLSKPRAEKLILAFVEMRGMLQTGRRPLELTAHAFQRRRTVEYERHVPSEVVKQRPQRIVARKRGACDSG